MISGASENTALTRLKDLSLDEEIRSIAHLSMGDVVYKSEYEIPHIGFPSSDRNAKQWLASSMFTDAVFNQDIRIIQTIINRIDGGLPKDTEIENYQTLFGDCMNDVLNMTKIEQLTVRPTDSVMMALCKSLFDLATKDIYYDTHVDPDGRKVCRKKKPSTEEKQTRDSALRLILERAGGRKTSTPTQAELNEVDVADWIKNALPNATSDQPKNPE